MAKIVVTQVKGTIGAKPKTRGTIRALGLGRIGRSRTHEDNPVVRGMIARVPHLVEVSEADAQSQEAKDERPREASGSAGASTKNQSATKE